MATFTTPDLITYVVNYNAAVARSLKRECGLGVTAYRMLAFLGDHIQGAQLSDLARILEKTPGMISITADKMLAEGLILRESAAAPQAIVRISKPGIDKLRDADIVLARTYEEYFAPLSANLKAVLSTGSMATNTSTGEGNRMREGHFFSAFEILHAFLIVETFLTNATHSSGLALTGFRMLYVLHEEGRPLSPSEIRRKLILKPSTTTYEIDRLLAGGYVQRTGNSLDRRSVLIALTDDGAAVFACAFPLVEAVFTSDIRPSGRTERDAYKDIAASIVASLKA